MHSAFRVEAPPTRSKPVPSPLARKKAVAPSAEQDEQKHGDLAQRADNILDGLSCWRCWLNERRDAAQDPTCDIEAEAEEK